MDRKSEGGRGDRRSVEGAAVRLVEGGSRVVMLSRGGDGRIRVEGEGNHVDGLLIYDHNSTLLIHWQLRRAERALRVLVDL